MGIKLHTAFWVIPAITPYGEVFYHIFNFDEFIFVHDVNIRLICDGKIYLLDTP